MRSNIVGLPDIEISKLKLNNYLGLLICLSCLERSIKIASEIRQRRRDKEKLDFYYINIVIHARQQCQWAQKGGSSEPPEPPWLRPWMD